MNELGAALIGFGATAVLMPLTAAAVLSVLPRASPPPAKPITTPTPKAKRHAMESGTGRERGLIEENREWLMGVLAPAPAPAVHMNVDPQDAFDSWFLSSFIIEDNPLPSDVASWAEWTTHYMGYCNAHHFPRLDDRGMVEAIKAYADTYACHFDATTGDFIGGCIRK